LGSKKIEKEDGVERVLLTFAGNTDPTRGQHDGPILHICRYYKPEKIYLILTQEMVERDENPFNIYEKAIKANLENYNPEIIRKYTDIKQAHLFDSYFEVLYETFEEIKSKYPDTEVLVNLTSGTSQMTTNLISYIIDATNIRIVSLQVATHENNSNREPLVDKKYNVELEAEMNFDNKESTLTNRIIKPDLRKYSRVLVKNQIQELLKQYKYTTCIELLKRNIFSQNEELSVLLKFANDRKNLKGLESNKRLRYLKNKKYNGLYYYDKNENTKKVKEWYKIIDYFALANIKQKTRDITGYVLMIEPITVKIYESILEDIMKKDLKQIFKYTSLGYKIDISKLDAKLKDYIEKDSEIYSLKSDTYVSDKILSSTIKYYNKKEKKIGEEDFLDLTTTLSQIKPVRNGLAHSLKSINRDDFEKEAKISISETNKKILEFFKKYYSDFGYKESMIYVYDEINKFINELLEQER